MYLVIVGIYQAYLSGSELHVPVMCLAYPCHNLFRFRRMRPANEIQPVIELQFDFCIPLHSVHQAQQDLFASCAPAGFFARCLRRCRRRRGGRRRRQQRRRRRPPVQGATEDRCDEVLGILAQTLRLRLAQDCRRWGRRAGCGPPAAAYAGAACAGGNGGWLRRSLSLQL